MTVPTRPQKNIWVAAGDGDLARVQELVEQHSLSPNVPDPFTYTPMHAAASYGHLHILEYLISRGGDVNVTDSDGDTPLYTVENVQTARFLVDHGAVIDRQNLEGVSPIGHLSEDFPDVANFLQTLLPSSASTLVQPSQQQQPSQHQQHVATEQLTAELMAQVHEIMQRAEAEGRDPDEELRRVVGRTVLQGVMTGFEMTTSAEEGDIRSAGRDDINMTSSKRPKTDDS